MIYFSKKLPKEPKERYRILSEAGYSPLFTAYQVHGADIIRLKEPYMHPGNDELFANQPTGDAIITDQIGLFVGVKTADCVPILLADRKAKVVAAVHAGWRGTAIEIAKKTVIAMKTEFGAREISAAIGPCICKKCFVTRSDVPNAMPEYAKKSRYIERYNDEQYLVDLQAINAETLRECGIEPEILDVCTCCNPSEYWSHRFHGKNRGLQVSLIGLDS